MNFNYLTLVQILQALRMILDIVIVWILLYYVIRIVRSNSRTTQIFKGIIFLVIVQAIARYFGLETLAYLTDNIMNWGFLALIIIFQPEIRALLEKVGKSNMFNRMNTLSGTEKEDLVQALMDATSNLAESKTGALITLEQANSLTDYIKTGVPMNSIVTAELICSIFMTTTPLHDGAIIIQGDRLACASAYFPPTQLDLPSRYGARHRAAIGISEITDAITIVVSEETGRVAIAEQGKLIQMNEKKLRAYLNRLILGKDTVTDETVKPQSAQSVSIDTLFKKENDELEVDFKADDKTSDQQVENKTNVAPGSKSVVIIDETKDDEESIPVVHKAQMKTFQNIDFKADQTNTQPIVEINKEEKEIKPVAIIDATAKNKKVEVKAVEKSKTVKEHRGLFQFLRHDKKTKIEKAVSQVAKEIHTTQQLKLKEIAEAEAKAEKEAKEAKEKLASTKKVVVPSVNKDHTTSERIKTISEVKPSATAAPVKIHEVKIAKVEIPQSPKVEITDLPPVKPIEITKVKATSADSNKKSTDEEIEEMLASLNNSINSKGGNK